MDMNRMAEVLAIIREYDSIVITRHIHPDGDALGSSRGLARILRLSFPEKKIYVLNDDDSAELAFLGCDDPEEDAELYRRSLMITCDCSTYDRISNRYAADAYEILKIDHHPDVDPFAEAEWVEENCSSTCEMIIAWYLTFRDELKIDREAAELLYTGLVTDSGRFRYESVNGDTLRRAAELLDMGIDTEGIYANLYTESFDELKFRAHICDKITITKNGVAYLFLDKGMQRVYKLDREQAGNCVSYMSGIRNSLIWIALIECDDGTIRVRLRSRYVPVMELAEKYDGGGHPNASGATLQNRSQINSLLAEADALLKEYKENNTGWM